MRRALLCGVAALTTLAAVSPAHAWKPKTHIYLAEEALRDAITDDKVTIYETDYRTGKIIGELGKFTVDPAILAALKAAPQQYRAGVLGPDAYPDILTGQQVIHPDEAHAVDKGAGGSNAWLTYLWRRGFVDGPSPQVRAFTVGYLTHAAGDVFAHTFVNHFAGGEFKLAPDPTNAAKHLVLEGYIGKRTPPTTSAIASSVTTGGPLSPRKREDLGMDEETVTRKTGSYYGTVTQNQVSISGVETFIYRELTYATPGSLLEQKLLKGDGVSRSIPYIFSTLRNGLQRQVEEYDRVRLSKSGPARASYVFINGAPAEYKRAWIKDIDDGLAAFPAVSHEIAKAIVYNEGGSDMARAKAVMDQYVLDHLASMAGAPDAAVATVAFISSVIDSILPPAMREGLRAMMQAPMDLLIKGVSGRTADEWADYMKNPETHFDEIMNRRGGAHSGEVDHPIDLATFNRDYLKIDDPGYSNASLKWRINDLPPAFNTLQLTKLMLLGDQGMSELSATLAAKGATMGQSPGDFRNLMLGWVRSLDAGNQWQGIPSKSLPSPQPAFAAQGGSAYVRLFLNQVGEKPWIAEETPQKPAEPPPEPAASQDLAPFAGDWDTTYGRVTLALGEDGVLRGSLTARAPDGREVAGGRLELRDGASAGVLRGQALHAAHVVEVMLTFDAARNTFSGTAQQAGSTSPSTWSGKRVATEEQAPPAPSEPPPAPAPAQPSTPPVPTGPVAQAGTFHALEDFDVRFERAVTARNGMVHVFLTAKNTTNRDISIGAGVFKAVAYDADGVGTSESQIWRTGAEIPESFSSTPIVPPGGELRFRFVMTPPSPTPFSVVNIRESDDKSLAFTLSGAQPGATLVPLRGLGSGPFKELTQFDVRIDSVTKARDGLTELFVTLRNPGPKVLTTSKGRIKFSAANPDGAKATTRSALYPVRGPRGGELPLLVYVAPGGEVRLRYVFEGQVSGPITVKDGTAEQTFAPGR